MRPVHKQFFILQRRQRIEGVASICDEGLRHLLCISYAAGLYYHGNDHAAQGEGALAALEKHDIVFIHIEAPDEAAHEGRIDQKIEAIEQIDKLVISRLRSRQDAKLRVLILPDHATPIKIMTHTPDPVPFVFWGPGFEGNGASSFSETSARETGLFIE